ncbi:MAG: sigma-70 family RNA polymerase sigma factor [Clostridiales bacterium]|nr:sigma-70 family RNA polymerase sigma factor [Clostridiales bacterium]
MNGKSDNLNEIIEQYYSDIYKYCRRRIDNVNDAYDVTQDVFLALCESWETVAPEKMQAWLLRVAKFKVDDFYRETGKIRKNFILDELDEQIHGALTNPFDELSDAEIDEIKANILGALDADELLLYHGAIGKKPDYTALSAENNVSEATMRQRVSRLKLKLMKSIRGFLSAIFL